MKRWRALYSTAYAALLVLGLTAPAAAQEYGSRLGVQRGGKVNFYPQGPGVLFDALDPSLKKWYIPQELYNEYRWRQWEYSNYAREQYKRYVNTNLQGDYFYDFFGNFVTRGWLIFNNVQRQPLQKGNQLFKDRNFTGWFNEMVVASDAKGQYYYALTIANGIRTTLTPMTFSKPDFDGVQFDVATDKYMLTFLYSRLSESGGSSTFAEGINRTNNTSLMGGRTTVQVGDFTTLGFNFINAHQSNTLTDGFGGNPLTGELTVDQKAEPISWIEILLSDDSPEDGEGGAAFFPAGSDITITYIDGTTERGKEIGFEPIIDGGFPQEGFISADGNEQIKLRYDFNSADFLLTASQDKTQIKKVEFDMVMGNDYKIQVASDRQTGPNNDPVFLMITQAAGNVKDNTNLKVISFEYGLPTATQVFGFTIELVDVAGFNLYGEFDNSHVYRKYPYPNNDQGNTDHSTSSGTKSNPSANAWMLNLSKVAYPWFFFGEAFNMDRDYATNIYVAEQDGFVDYTSGYYQNREPGNIERFVVDFVEDNDDQDRTPDWGRNDALVTDFAVFPGWDENNDFIPDFNQNDNGRRINLIPDYEEPFIRQNVDRPEFLYGIDANNNTWADRFENDTRPDYPYQLDHRGFNTYGGVYLLPVVRLTVGHLREKLRSAAQKNYTTYGLLTMDVDYPTWGRFRAMESLKSIEDDIPDDLLQWDNRSTLRNDRNVEVKDPLLGRDTWFNSLYLSHDYSPLADLRLKNSIKHDLWHQRLGAAERRRLGLNSDEFFFGIINKLEYLYRLGSVEFMPRWKSEYRRQTYDLFTRDQEAEELTEILGALVQFPFLKSTVLSSGIEYVIFRDLRSKINNYRSFITAGQLTNVAAYQGYELSTQVGMKFDVRDFKDPGVKTKTVTEGFITVYAGLGK
ncbi:MAG: hypothetical protein EXS58_09485 [Candidatus Latescibacteria bacterium]|nr:hypothetical protein [Candidatus Latescibacterota bacterium]